MSKELTFNEIKGSHFKRLAQYVPIVDRVHGAHHPEFHDVNKVFETMLEKTKLAGFDKPDLSIEFKMLRDITNNYKVPTDVCETFEAVYNMLGEADCAYYKD